MVHALELLHSALGAGGLLVDTQPVSPAPAVMAAGERLGTLDMHNWLRTIQAVDVRVDMALATGLFAIEAEETLLVSDVFDEGAELVRVVSDWKGTRIASALARRAEAEPGPLSVDQDVRVRVMRPLTLGARSVGRSRRVRAR